MKLIFLFCSFRASHVLWIADVFVIKVFSQALIYPESSIYLLILKFNGCDYPWLFIYLLIFFNSIALILAWTFASTYRVTCKISVLSEFDARWRCGDTYFLHLCNKIQGFFHSEEQLRTFIKDSLDENILIFFSKKTQEFYTF